METPDTQSLRDLLNEVLSRKRTQNGRYSLRAFARDAGLQPPELSEFLKGKRVLSSKKIHCLARSSAFSSPERSRILSFVSEPTFASTGDQIELSLEQFQILADWVHFAIFAMIESDAKIPNHPSMIAKRLSIPETRVRAGLKRLIDLGHLKKMPSGSWKKSKPVFFVRSEGASQALREFNLAMLEKSREAAAHIAATERHAASSTLCVSRRDLPLARTLIDAFTQQFSHELATTKHKKDEVFHLNIHYFSLEKGKTK